MADRLLTVLEKIKKFRDEREWAPFHNHKDMAISVLLEAAELLEHFQWKNPQEVANVTQTEKTEIEEEIADVFIYLLELADNLGIDLISAAERKIQKNEAKYPVDKARSVATKYTKL